jgi:hypothetical protein
MLATKHPLRASSTELHLYGEATSSRLFGQPFAIVQEVETIKEPPKTPLPRSSGGSWSSQHTQ